MSSQLTGEPLEEVEPVEEVEQLDEVRKLLHIHITRLQALEQSTTLQQ